MARPLRVEYPGALYHVTSRGNARQDIYLDDVDRSCFLEILADVVKSYNWLCHAYCLMGNHYHLLIETIDANLSIGMRDLNGIYTQKFNKRHKTVGHILQGRYRAFVIEKETYLLSVARYIVLNPVRANMVDHPSKWKWSSYRMTAGIIQPSPALTTDWILGCFHSRKNDAQRQYRLFIDAGINMASPFNEAVDGFILGSPQFRHSIWEKTDGSEEIKEIPRQERIVGRPTLKELFDDVKNKKERDKLIRVARGRCGYLNSEIAVHLGLDRSTVGKIVRGRSS